MVIKLGPKTADITIASIRSGKHINISENLISIFSIFPPKYPAVIPMSVPKTIPNITEEIPIVYLNFIKFTICVVDMKVSYPDC